MANGASRIFNIMKSVAESSKDIAQFVQVSTKSLDPLIFNLDDKVDLTEDFYQLDRTLDLINLELGVVFQAIVLNNGQLYFILSNGENQIGVFYFIIDDNGHLILNYKDTRPDFILTDNNHTIPGVEPGHLVLKYAGDITPNVYIDENGHCIYNY